MNVCMDRYRSTCCVRQGQVRICGDSTGEGEVLSSVRHDLRSLALLHVRGHDSTLHLPHDVAAIRLHVGHVPGTVIDRDKRNCDADGSIEVQRLLARFVRGCMSVCIAYRTTSCGLATYSLPSS